MKRGQGEERRRGEERGGEEAGGRARVGKIMEHMDNMHRWRVENDIHINKHSV